MARILRNLVLLRLVNTVLAVPFKKRIFSSICTLVFQEKRAYPSASNSAKIWPWIYVNICKDIYNNFWISVID